MQLGPKERSSFHDPALPEGLVADLRRMNPWWGGKPSRVLPATRRHLVAQIHRRLELGLAPVVVVRGARQIGKTTAQLQVLADLLDRGVPTSHVLRVQADELTVLGELDEPILRVVDWYEAEVLGKTLNEAARDGQPAYLFFDEIQNLEHWAPQIKFLVDHSTTQVVITGSSAQTLDQELYRLAGRATTILAE